MCSSRNNLIKDSSNQANFCGKLIFVSKVVLKGSLAFLSRFYTHEQALEAIFQSQRMVLGDNLLKVSRPIFQSVCTRPFFYVFDRTRIKQRCINRQHCNLLEKETISKNNT